VSCRISFDENADAIEIHFMLLRPSRQSLLFLRHRDSDGSSFAMISNDVPQRTLMLLESIGLFASPGR
jgi:hypothetical protein